MVRDHMTCPALSVTVTVRSRLSGRESVVVVFSVFIGAAFRLGQPALTGRLSPGFSALCGVSAVSAADAWAVGLGGNSLILHWDGSRWTRS